MGGGAVARACLVRGQAGRQLVVGAYQAREKEIARGAVTMYPRTEMLDVIVVNGKARGIVVRDLVTGQVSSHLGHAVILASGGYGNVFYLSTNAKGSTATAIWRAYKRGAAFANPCYTPIQPTCLPQSGPYQPNSTVPTTALRDPAHGG